jgi:hypothetical protein
MKKQPTPEQKAKAEERREQFRRLVKTLADMPEEKRIEMVCRVGAVVTCEGHALSIVNTNLCIMQRDNVSMVGGFAQWLKHGRAVRKGEHGLGIWVPIKGKSDNNGPADVSHGGEPIAEAKDAKANPGTRFMMGTVFDISQTQEIPPAPVALRM